MIKSNTVKRLIGTGAIAFAFFSASLAMGTPVYAEENQQLSASTTSNPTEGQVYEEGRELGFKNGFEHGSENGAEKPNYDFSNIEVRRPTDEKSPYDDNPNHLLKQTYWEGYNDDYHRGYGLGYEDKHPEFTPGVPQDTESDSAQDGNNSYGFFSTVFELFAGIYTFFTTLFY